MAAGTGDFERFSVWWPFRGVRKKFMNSDFLGNYSRGYVWAANQLSHAAIGLVAAFAYVWILDAFLRGLLATRAVHEALRDDGFNSAFAALTRDAGENGLLIVLSFSLLLLLFVGLGRAFWTLTTRRGLLSDLAAERRTRATHEGEWPTPPPHLVQATAGRLAFERALNALLTAAVVGAFGLAAYLSLVALSVNISGVYNWRSEVVAGVLGTLGFAAVAAVVSRSALHTLMAWSALAIAGFLWTENRTLPRFMDDISLAGLLRLLGDPLNLASMVDGVGWPHVLFVLLTAMLLASLAAAYVRSRRRAAPRPSPAFTAATLLFAFGALWITALQPQVDGFWPDFDKGVDNAVAALFASLALCWAKEFGTDLRLGELEVDLAHERRMRNGHPVSTPRADGSAIDHMADVRDAQQGCIDDLTADTRTDSVFYLVGALLAGAVIASPGLFTDSLWRSMFATGAALAFMVVYTLIGWRWMRRCAALDKVGVLAATRFAMIESAVSVRFIDPDGRPIPETTALRDGRVDGPFTRLAAFARGRLTTSGARSDGGAAVALPVRHLIICGHVGSGRSPLGHAIACEATLDPTPPLFSGGGRWRKAGDIRRARFQPLVEIYEQNVFAARIVDRDDELRGRDGADAERARDAQERVGREDVFVIDDADPIVAEARAASMISNGVPPGAQLPFHDHVDGATQSDRRRAIEDALRLLYVDLGAASGAKVEDLTVWIIPARVEAPSLCSAGGIWDPEIPNEAVEFANELRVALANVSRKRASDLAASASTDGASSDVDQDAAAAPPAASVVRADALAVAMVGRAPTGSTRASYAEILRRNVSRRRDRT